MTDAKPNGVVM